MLTNCPLGKKETHACWECLYGIELTSDNRDVSGYDCAHPDYKETYKVKPRKVTHGFCTVCGKSVKFRLGWDGVASPTRKGIITYKELYAYCPHCNNQIYVPAVNDVNVYHRNKAYAEKVPEEPLKIGTQKDLIKMCEQGYSFNNDMEDI